MNQPTAAVVAANPQVLEQYKAKLADLGNLGTRQTAMTTYYVSILTALLGVLAFKERSLSAIDGTIILAVCLAGFSVSAMWFTGVTFFRNLFRAKLKVLEEIEKSLPYQTFATEHTMMQDSGRASWLKSERFVPVIFAIVFAGVLLSRFMGPVIRTVKCLAP